MKISLLAEVETIRFILLEEDCDWVLAYKFTGIKHRRKPAEPTYVERIFNQHFKDKAA